VGCFNGTGVSMAITSYDSMTITLCVEACRALNKSFAFLGSTSCGCDSSHTIYSREFGRCQEPCSGQNGSVCGGTDSLMSVYDTSNIFVIFKLSWIPSRHITCLLYRIVNFEKYILYDLAILGFCKIPLLKSSWTSLRVKK